MSLLLRVILAAVLALAILQPTPAAAAESGTHGPHGLPESTSTEQFQLTLRRLHQRRIALTVHQVLATSAFASSPESCTVVAGGGGGFRQFGHFLSACGDFVLVFEPIRLSRLGLQFVLLVFDGGFQQ